MQYNSPSGKINFNHLSKEEQRRLLYCNKAGNRCSSLGCGRDIPPDHMKSYIELGKILKRIHVRLISEGWKIESGRFIKPDGTLFYAKDQTGTN